MKKNETGLVELEIPRNFNVNQFDPAVGAYEDAEFRKCDDIVAGLVSKYGKPREIRKNFDFYIVEIEGLPEIRCYPPARAGSVRVQAATLEFTASDGQIWRLRDRDVLNNALVAQFIAALS